MKWSPMSSKAGAGGFAQGSPGRGGDSSKPREAAQAGAVCHVYCHGIACQVVSVCPHGDRVEACAKGWGAWGASRPPNVSAIEAGSLLFAGDFADRGPLSITVSRGCCRGCQCPQNQHTLPAYGSEQVHKELCCWPGSRSHGQPCSCGQPAGAVHGRFSGKLACPIITCASVLFPLCGTSRELQGNFDLQEADNPILMWDRADWLGGRLLKKI